MSDLQNQAIRQHCKVLRMPTIGGQFARLSAINPSNSMPLISGATPIVSYR